MERSIDRHRGGEISNDLQASATAPRGRLEPSGSVCKRSASGASLLGGAQPDPRHAFATHPLTLAGHSACSDRPIAPCAAPRQPARRVFPQSFQRVRSFPPITFRIAVGLALVFSLLLTISPASFAALQRRTCRTLISYFRWDMVTSLRSPRACTARGQGITDHTGENVLDNLDIQ